MGSTTEFRDTAGASMGTATDPTSFDSSSNGTSDSEQEDRDGNEGEEDLEYLYEPPSAPSFLCRLQSVIKLE